MKFALISLLIFSGALIAGNQPPADTNVNSRYRIESIEMPREIEGRISKSLRHDVQKLIGENFNAAALRELALRIRNELNVRSVSQKVVRGSTPDHVKVVLSVEDKTAEFDLSVPKFLYHSKQGWSGDLEAATRVGKNTFTVGLVSDGDDLTERYAGIHARYENKNLVAGRLGLRFQFETYHQQWNRSTLEALAVPGAADDVSGIYRARRNFEPVATINIAKPLTLSVGMSFEQFETQVPAARTETANAMITTLRYHRRAEDSDPNQHQLDAGYSLRAATRALSSDFVYAKHRWNLRYIFSRNRHRVMDEVTAGVISGRAPLFERYVLGTSGLLRGWNKWELDPLGGSRMVHNTVEYRYRIFEIFYDTGAIWSAGQDATPRHSLGVGLRKGVFALALAFPVRDGRIEPMFMVGMNY